MRDKTAPTIARGVGEEGNFSWTGWSLGQARLQSSWFFSSQTKSELWTGEEGKRERGKAPKGEYVFHFIPVVEPFPRVKYCSLKRCLRRYLAKLGCIAGNIGGKYVAAREWRMCAQGGKNSLRAGRHIATPNDWGIPVWRGVSLRQAPRYTIAALILVKGERGEC